MKLNWLKTTFILLLLWCSSCLSQSPEFKQEEVENILNSYNNLGSFSGVVFIAEENSILFQKAMGFANRKDSVPNTMNTKFHLGSIIKIFTQILVLQLAEEGKLSLNDPISKYLDIFHKPEFDEITIQQVLSHKAGFNDIFVPEYVLHIRELKTIDDKLKVLQDDPLIAQPGTREKYSNYGYVVLGAIIEKITKSTFDQVLASNIFEPIGMSNSYFDIAENIPGAARSYRFLSPEKIIDHTALLEYPTPDGGGYTTAKDLHKFIHSLLYTDNLLSDEYKSYLTTEFKKKSSGKWRKFVSGSNMVSESGGGPGISSIVRVIPDARFFIIVLANYDRDVASSVAYRITDACLSREYPEPRLAAETILYQNAMDKGWDYVTANFTAILDSSGYGTLSGDTYILNKFGYDLLWALDLENAKEVFQSNIDLFPRAPGPYDSMGELYYYLGEYKEAESWYKKALEIDPEYDYSTRMLERLYRKYPSSF